jgi:hypothetical protein
VSVGTATRVLISGLDLGKTGDPSALVVLDKSEAADPRRGGRVVARYAVRYVKRWRLGLDFVAQLRDLVGLFAGPPLAGTVLAVDHTGIGRVAVDVARGTRLDARLVPVTITGGRRPAVGGDGGWRVPKRVLVATARAVLSERRLTIPRSLPDAPVLVRELTDFRTRTTKAANKTYSAPSGGSDDVLMALALALYVAELGLAE